MNQNDEKRDSKAFDPELISDPLLKAEAEARNGLKQYDAGLQAVQTALERGIFKLRPSLILGLHREALAGLSPFAGSWRPASVMIQGSKHQPPDNFLVPELIEDMCDYVNERWNSTTSLHLASYLMWRLNWIHPFADGNGRTSRILSYVVMSIHAGSILPGTPTIPDQIVENRKPYFDALDAADAAFLENEGVDVSQMEDLLDSMLALQLTNFYKSVGGSVPTGP